MCNSPIRRRSAMSTVPALDLKFETRCTLDVHDYETAALHGMLAESLARGGPGLPFFRRDQVAARIDPPRLLERFASRTGWQVQRPDPVTLVARTAGAFAIIIATGTSTHCTMSFRLWAAAPRLADTLAAELLAEVASCRISETLFRLEWRFVTCRGRSRAVTMERPQDVLVDEAYPTLPGGVHVFLQRYLDAPESVLVLQGPAGMGKTRLIRALLREMSLRKDPHGDEHAVALYSGDRGVWESDEIFVEFITGDHDAFLIEDADHLITPRANGNQSLHRFLNVSDGIAQAQGRKIIFSTNLPGVRDLDDALVRPGRCFAHVHMRYLQRDEAHRLLARLCADDKERLASGMQWLEGGRTSFSVAEVYAAHRKAGVVIDAGAEHSRAASGAPVAVLA